MAEGRGLPVMARMSSSPCGRQTCSGRRPRCCHLHLLLVIGTLGIGQPQATENSQSASTEMRWDWTGCNALDLCECKRHGEVAGIKGTDIASACLETGYAVPKVDQLHKLTEAMGTDKLKFQCESLKLNIFCYSQNGCLTDLNKAMCNEMKGTSCDADCDSAMRGWASPLSVAAAAVAGAAVLPVLLQPRTHFG
mmetsp:Transcript_50126/g.126355  ORF Transcript_50126/g.126355 Transcript_50126/m.126355 type:complete len:194 (-) Transcript_50126:101-682(-)